MFNLIQMALFGRNSGGSSGGGGLPVVELTTKANLMEEGAEVALSEAENAALNVAWDKNLPCVISVGVEGMSDVLMGAFIRHDDGDVSYKANGFEALFYHAFVGILIVTVRDPGNGWLIRVDMYHPEGYMPS